MTYSQIWRDIKAAKHEPTTQEVRDLLSALHCKFSLSDQSRIALMLCKCCELADELAELEESNEAAADWVKQRDERARLADRVPVTFSAREVPEFLSTAI